MPDIIASTINRSFRYDGLPAQRHGARTATIKLYTLQLIKFKAIIAPRGLTYSEHTYEVSVLLFSKCSAFHAVLLKEPCEVERQFLKVTVTV